jgi:hypothetical protein
MNEKSFYGSTQDVRFRSAITCLAGATPVALTDHASLHGRRRLKSTNVPNLAAKGSMTDCVHELGPHLLMEERSHLQH